MSKTYTFDSKFELGEELPNFTQDEVKNEPMLVGALVWAIGLSLGAPTGYAINPARDLGPRIAHAILPIAGKGGSDWGYSWIPVVGPMAGGAIAAVALKALI